MDGGIAGLLGLIEAHRGAVEYDWRTRFHMPLAAIGSGLMTITEAARLAHQLLVDPASHTFAAANDWAYPMSRDALVTADLYDMQHASKTKKKPDLYPRPWPDRKHRTERHGDAGGRTAEQIGDILRGFGHDVVKGEVIDDGR